MQSIALPCNNFAEGHDAVIPRAASALPSIRQLGMEDLNSSQSCCFCDDGVHAWVFSYSELFNIPTLQDSLSALEWERAALFASKKLADKYSYARGALRAVLSQYSSVTPENITFEYAASGKPFIKSNPLYFNLSHSGDLVFIVVSETHELGVDVEFYRPIPDALSIAENWFSDMETTWIKSSPCNDEAFLRCWVIREAFVKAVGCGLKLPLDSFGILLPDFFSTEKEMNGIRSPLITKHAQCDDVQILELTLQNNYLAAIAALRV